MARKKPDSVAQDVLLELQQRGITSPMLEARLDYTNVAQLLNQHLLPMQGEVRVYPNLMNPQASGRVGTAKPPIGNFTADKKYGPHGIRDVVRPDPGTSWVCFDEEALEARLIGHACQDPVDQEAFDKGYDLHTVTGVRMFKWPEPDFEPTKSNLWTTVGGLAWCERIATIIGERDSSDRLVPYDDGCRTRRLVKNTRYALNYALNEKATGRYAVEMKMPVKQLWAIGKLYLASKPWLTSWKRRVWAESWKTGISRTAFGRRRLLCGGKLAQMKEGLNHRIQGTGADIMKIIIAAVHAAGYGKVYQTHDGCKFIVGNAPGQVAAALAEIKPLVERTWDLWGRPCHISSTWEVIHG